MPKVKINGKEKTIRSLKCMKELLDDLGLDPLRVAVELNGQVLKREQFESTELSDGDVIEIVRFVGGG